MLPFLRRLPLAAILFCGQLLAADLSTQPAVIVRAQSAGTWTVIASDLSVVQPWVVDGQNAILVTGQGRYRVLWAGGGQSLTTLVNVGGSDVVPPDTKPIDPPKPPTPPVPDVTPLAEMFVTVLQEQQDATPAQQRVIDAGQAWIRQHKHNLRILDPDAKDRENKPSPDVASIKSIIGDAKLPVVVICDPTGGHVTNFPLPATGEEFVKQLSKWGK